MLKPEERMHGAFVHLIMNTILYIYIYTVSKPDGLLHSQGMNTVLDESSLVVLLQPKHSKYERFPHAEACAISAWSRYAAKNRGNTAAVL